MYWKKYTANAENSRMSLDRYLAYLNRVADFSLVLMLEPTCDTIFTFLFLQFFDTFGYVAAASWSHLSFVKNNADWKFGEFRGKRFEKIVFNSDNSIFCEFRGKFV